MVISLTQGLKSPRNQYSLTTVVSCPKG